MNHCHTQQFAMEAMSADYFADNCVLGITIILLYGFGSKRFTQKTENINFSLPRLVLLLDS